MEYSRIKHDLLNCPDTYVCALLTHLLERAASIPVFKPGGLTELARRIETNHKNEGSVGCCLCNEKEKLYTFGSGTSAEIRICKTCANTIQHDFLNFDWE